MRPVSDAQVRKLMEEMTKHGEVGHASMKAGMDRKTGRKYVATGRLPSELKSARDWRTREDPFAEHWAEMEARLRESPGLEALTLFDVLREAHPGVYADGQLRTLQRRVRRWRAEQGPERDVVMEQRHRPGEATQTDFTVANVLGVTIAGALFMHMLCVVTLPFSNWQWATVCLSESLSALRRGLQRALFQLGRIPKFNQTDHSTAATHRIPAGAGERLDSRTFNTDYLAVMRHFGITPRTTEVGAKEQNGDVEASNGAIKRRLEQALLVRGNREFDTTERWQSFIDDVLRRSNENKRARVAEDLAAMRELNVARLPEYIEENAWVCERCTIRVKRHVYSVPSRLIGEWLKVRVYEDIIEAYHGELLQLRCERLRGEQRHRVDYRHIIWSLVQKPGAFARYVYREEMFPSTTFRRAYDAIQQGNAGTKGDLEYLRILHLAAVSLEADVEAALGTMLADAVPITADAVKKRVPTDARVNVPEMVAPIVDLGAYDALLQEVGA